MPRRLDLRIVTNCATTLPAGSTRPRESKGNTPSNASLAMQSVKAKHAAGPLRRRRQTLRRCTLALAIMFSIRPLSRAFRRTPGPVTGVPAPGAVLPFTTSDSVAGPRSRSIIARYPGTCSAYRAAIRPGDGLRTSVNRTTAAPPAAETAFSGLQRLHRGVRKRAIRARFLVPHLVLQRHLVLRLVQVSSDLARPNCPWDPPVSPCPVPA